MKKIVLASLGVIVLLLLGGLYLQRSGRLDASLVQQCRGASCPDGSTRTANLGDYGMAPEFAGISSWLNSDPLTMEQLRGKVVLVDFWTYSCINCIRTLPHVTGWYEKYRDAGLVVVGVHTPEFAFEKDRANVQRALEQHGISYPVALDNGYATWNAYSNRYWPAKYLVNQRGEVVYKHFGEGKYDETEAAIRTLLGLDPAGTAGGSGPRLQVATPEVYFGTHRLELLGGGQRASAADRRYTLPDSVDPNTFALGGTWRFDPEYAQLAEGSGQIRIRFSASQLNIVASAEAPATVTATVDGVAQPSVTVSASQLYTLFSGEPGWHEAVIDISGAGFRAFTFTFG